MEHKGSKEIGILGVGGQADEAISYTLSTTEVVFRAIHESYRKEKDDKDIINILSPDEFQRIIPVVAAVGAPAIRKKMVESWPGEYLETIIAQQSYIDKSSKIGEGSIIAPFAVITTNVEVGRHAIINIAATISHNCLLGEYVTVSPGAHIGGNVDLGDGVFVGIGAIIKNGVRIASGSVIGAGAVVIKDIEAKNSVVVGNPAKTIRINSGWLDAI